MKWAKIILIVPDHSYSDNRDMINKIIKLKLQYFKHVYVQATYQRDPEVYAMVPKYILTPNLAFLPQIIYSHALGSTLLELF